MHSSKGEFLQKEQIIQIAKELHNARMETSPVEQYSKNIQDFKIPDAYSIQELGIKMREESGEKIIGYKMGLTSKAKRDQMNLKEPCYGVLTDKMEIADQGIFSMANSIHPKIEPEIFFKISRDLEGHVTRNEVVESISWVGAALEILDSRYEQFKYFSLEDVVADNSSSSHFILGKNLMHPEDLDIENLKMVLRVDGKDIEQGVSRDISGNPLDSVVELVHLLAERNKMLPKDSIVLAGAATPALALNPGMHIDLEVDLLGHVDLVVAP